MARWTGTWLTGLGSAGITLGDRARYRGERLGLPERGQGSVATFGVRGAAFVVDIVLATLAAGLINLWVDQPSDAQRNVAGYVSFTVMTVLGLALVGRTPGMTLVGLRVLPLRGDPAALGLWPAVLRTVVLATFVLALVMDRDGRGLHDRLANTVVVRG